MMDGKFQAVSAFWDERNVLLIVQLGLTRKMQSLHCAPYSMIEPLLLSRNCFTHNAKHNFVQKRKYARNVP